MLFLSLPSPNPRKFQDTAENIFFFPRKVCSTTTVSSLYPFYIYIYILFIECQVAKKDFCEIQENGIMAKE